MPKIPVGFSRDSFYRFKDLYEKGGEAAQIEMSRRVPNPKNRIGETIERRILEMTLKQPAWGHTRMANELAKEGLRLSPTGVRGVWVRHDLNTMAKRLKALEARVAQDGLILTESQLAALEKAKADKEAPPAHGTMSRKSTSVAGGSCPDQAMPHDGATARAREVIGSVQSAMFRERSRCAIVASMDARHDDLIHSIVEAIMAARYTPPKRRRSAWHERYDEDLQQARRVAVAIVDALQTTGYRISRDPPAPPHHAP